MKPEVGKVSTTDELGELGIVHTNEYFADCHIFRRGNERFLLKKEGEKYRIVFAYTLSER